MTVAFRLSPQIWLASRGTENADCLELVEELGLTLGGPFDHTSGKTGLPMSAEDGEGRASITGYLYRLSASSELVPIGGEFSCGMSGLRWSAALSDAEMVQLARSYTHAVTPEPVWLWTENGDLMIPLDDATLAADVARVHSGWRHRHKDSPI